MVKNGQNGQNGPKWVLGKLGPGQSGPDSWAPDSKAPDSLTPKKICTIRRIKYPKRVLNRAFQAERKVPK